MEPYASFPLREICRLRGSDCPFFATFNFVDFHNAPRARSADGVRLLRYRGHDRFHFPLNYFFSVNRLSGAIDMTVQYREEFFDAGTVQAMTARLSEVLWSYVEAG
jgi:hypothetical protein